MCLDNVLGKALTPRNCRGIAEPELLLGGVSGVRARAADIDGFLFAFLTTTLPLRVMFPLAVQLATSSPPNCRCHCGNDINLPCFLIRRSLQRIPSWLPTSSSASLPKNLRQFVILLSVRTTCWKKVRIDANNAKDSKVEPPVSMSGGKNAVHLQLIGADPDVLVNDASTIKVLGICLWLGDLNNDLVRRRPA